MRRRIFITHSPTFFAQTTAYLRASLNRGEHYPFLTPLALKIKGLCARNCVGQSYSSQVWRLKPDQVDESALETDLPANYRPNVAGAGAKSRQKRVMLPNRAKDCRVILD